MLNAMSAGEHRLILLRHGETAWSAARRHTGRTDCALTEAGEAQARAAAKLLAGLNLRDPLILTSPRERAVRTAELAGLRGAVIDDDLVEWDYGDYEGLTTPEIQQRSPGWTIFTGETPGGETAEQVGKRADHVLSRVVPELSARDVLLVGHGHFSRVLIARWCEFEVIEGRRFFMSTAAVTVLGHDHQARTVVHHNLVPPLDPQEGSAA
ncbi:acid phosphatase [Nocardia seriolae]|uniref:Phosphoglycerate mutase n=1 Tax=Nocardia seriolae TaxID=37332 RepID=A0A0B8N2S7_9NOCA|nr:acid phosphatase [Nocardia seriolae]GEM24014.1 putative phosphoglycerate mutase EntD [Nocardia seriolae NBRC 15557]MTJ71621.1 acid phosphatase [Nocardia seriolae]MTJ86338.1 acid phosphatase [Nocardia seriolae]MTK30332.1 acid phosphatase [Nocardia seriolae]